MGSTATANAIFSVDELSNALDAYVNLADGGGSGGKGSTTGAAASVASAAAVAVAETTTTGGGYDRWTLRDDATINYGALSRTGGAGIAEASADGDDSNGGYYITTAINYTNGPAHMGHAYEATTSDVIARYRRLAGEGPVYFVTGADEHGQKIAGTAADAGKQPQEICDKYCTGFKVLNQRVLISNDDYVRTTSERHKRTARALWEKCAASSGDIYLDTYSGWYNVREETFVTDSEAALLDYKDATSGLPLKQVKEESYFFKMSKYRDRLLKHIEENPKFIMPEQHRNQILARLRADDLRDLSISRTTFSWGISVPDGFDQKHVMYVWVDALSNYLTGVNGLGANDDGSIAGLEKFWPANVHIIGKDILWFHTVIWPCLLMSAGIPLPRTVFAHGFVNDKEGKKMSKSMGNVVDPHDMLDRFHVDTFRWYLCKEAPYGGELAFSEDSMRDMHNADLCDTVGNLVHRATNLCQKFCQGVVPDVPPPTKDPVDWKAVLDSYQQKMDDYELQGGANIAMQAFRDVNGYLQEQAPWSKKGDEHDEERRIIVRTCLEAIYGLSHLLLPFLPSAAGGIFDEKLHTPAVTLKQLKRDGRNLKPGTKIDVGDVLYTKSLSEAEQKDAAAAALAKKESFAEAQKRKKEAKAKTIAASKKGQKNNNQSGDDPNQPPFTKLEIRVGQIVKVWNHENSEKLFCEEIDAGEEAGGIRQVASGLREFYSLEDMQNKKVLVICNLKPAKLGGFSSSGMVLAAKSADGTKVELVSPPEDAVVGEKVFIAGVSDDEKYAPQSAAQVKKRKTFELVAQQLRTGADRVACWEGKALETSAGPCAVPTLTDAAIS